MAGRLPYVLIFGTAFVLRLLVPLTGQGLVGNYSYDASVYYAAGAALVHGRDPYRDFILLHPPGVTMAVAPAAWLGRVTSDHTGFAFATIEFIAMGAASATLVAVVARGLGAGRWASTAGGLFYAMWLPSIRAEHLSRLEPLGNLLLLCGLAGFVRIGGRHSTRAALLCGAGLGAAASVKIWYIAPVAVVACFLAAQRRPGDALRVVTGAFAAIGAICGPFFVLAQASMWRMIVTDQLSREPRDLRWTAAIFIAAMVAGAVAVLLMAARRAPIMRLPAALLLANGAVLVAAPSWFVFSADYLTPAASLCVATGVTAARTAGFGTAPVLARPVAMAGSLLALATLVVPAIPLWYGRGGPTRPLPASELTSAVAPVPCIVSDSPMALIGLNALHRNLANGCPNWVDVTGRTYAPDMDLRTHDGKRLPRSANPRWQRALRDYLLSGDAVVIVRATQAGISAATLRALRRGRVLATDGIYIVYSASN